ncbi:hypothetical protein [Streptomyces mirabilis]|uniref:hypothetical protein n=1 Tax=Streptomyces mirabilis TaxID=68239 RepID=UPI00367B768E
MTASARRRAQRARRGLRRRTNHRGGPLADSVRVNFSLSLARIGHETTASHLCWTLIDLLLQHYDRELLYPGPPDRARPEQETQEPCRVRFRSADDDNEPRGPKPPRRLTEALGKG